ncbi:MAG: OmpH family outer membrane protein [Chitinophagaceae bacterium]
MKQIISAFAIALIFLTAAGSVNAQSKIAHITPDQIVALMPERGKIDTLLAKFQADSLNSTLNSMVQEYQYKDSMLNKVDTSKTPKQILNQYRLDLQNLTYNIQNWNNLAQQIMQQKQAQMYQPIYKKVSDAINAVAKEKGYAYVFQSEVLLVAPPSDDITLLVATKLGIKVPGAPAATKPTK